MGGEAFNLIGKTFGTGFGDNARGSAFPPGFVLFGVLIALVGVGTFVFRLTTARRMAREAGLNPNDATVVSLLDNDGLGATYVAASVNRARGGSPASAPTAEARLRELQELRDKGLVTPAEYDQRRQAILSEV